MARRSSLAAVKELKTLHQQLEAYHDRKKNNILEIIARKGMAQKEMMQVEAQQQECETLIEAEQSTVKYLERAANDATNTLPRAQERLEEAERLNVKETAFGFLSAATTAITGSVMG